MILAVIAFHCFEMLSLQVLASAGLQLFLKKYHL